MNRGPLSIAAALLAFGLRAQASNADANLTPADIFAKHVAAVGYSLAAGSEAPYQMTLKTTWKDKRGKHIVTATEKFAGTYFNYLITRDGITRTGGFDGHVFWSADESGNVTNDIGYGRPFDVTEAIIQSEAFGDWLKPELRPATGGDYVIRISPSSGVPADIFFNQSTFFIDRVIVDPDRENIDESYSEYHKFGTAFIATLRKSGDTSTTVSDVRWNAALTGDDFIRPQQRTYAVFPAGGAASADFENKHYPGIVVHATVNGVEGRFLLDTGASGIFMNPSFARRAKLATHGHGTSEMVGGYSGLTFAPVASFKIGELELKSFTVMVPDNDFLGDEFDGLLGYSVLNQTVFAINFDTNRITFYDPATWSRPPSAGYLAIAMDDGTPQLQAMINTKVPVYMDLDLGASGVSLIFTRSFLQSNPGIVQGDLRGFGGMMGTLAQLDLGPFQFFGLSAVVLTTDRGFGGEKVLQGLIGYETLRRFNLTFDYQSNKLYLDLNKYGKKTKFDTGQR